MHIRDLDSRYCFYFRKAFATVSHKILIGELMKWPQTAIQEIPFQYTEKLLLQECSKAGRVAWRVVESPWMETSKAGHGSEQPVLVNLALSRGSGLDSLQRHFPISVIVLGV